MAGRPRKTNEELELSGSRNIKVGQIESGDLIHPEIAPSYLTSAGEEAWLEIVPPLVAAGTVKEADRTLLAMLCADSAKFHDTTVDSDGKPTVDEKERQRIGKRISDISDKFGMSPLARARSGVNKKTAGVKTRPQ